jgi:hypothetical protein
MTHRVPMFCAAIAVLLTIVVSGCDSDRSENAAALQVRQMAMAAATLLNAQMDARVTDTMLCAATCERCREAFSAPEARQEANQALDKWLKISGNFEAILVVDKTGACVASALAGLLGKDFSGDEAFKGAIKGRLTLSEFHKSDLVASLDPKSEGWTLSIAAPVRAGDEASGALISYVKWSRLYEMTRSFNVGQTGFVSVLDRQNQVIMHPDNKLYGTNLENGKVDLPEYFDAVKNKAPFARFEFKSSTPGFGGMRLVGLAYPKGYDNFPGLGWTVSATVFENEIAGPRRSWERLFR